MGFQIDRVQHGLDPDHWKPMKTVGAGVREIRVNDPAGAFRAIYVATLADAVVLPCLSKEDIGDRQARSGSCSEAVRGIGSEDKMTKEQRFASVWDAIETSPTQAASMKARSDLMMAVRKIVDGWKETQALAAKRLGITQPRLNDLLRGRIDKFSLDALMDLAPRAGLSVHVKIRRAA
jgi:predicted XRE-type DNA-binding protein/putative component of toxin-antitoxin plasmid stabilization module